MNASVSHQIQMSNPNINFGLTGEQVELTAHALAAATGRNSRTDVFTIEDVARAIILLWGGAYLKKFEDMPDYSLFEDCDHHVVNYMDGVAELDRLSGRDEWQGSDATH